MNVVIARELRVFGTKRLSEFETALDVLQKVEVVVEITFLRGLPERVFDVVLGLEDAVELKCAEGVGGVVVLLTRGTAF